MVHKRKKTSYMGLIQWADGSDSNIAFFDATSDAEAIRKKEQYEADAMIKLDKDKVKWIKDRLDELK